MKASEKAHQAAQCSERENSSVISIPSMWQYRSVPQTSVSDANDMITDETTGRREMSSAHVDAKRHRT